MTAVLEVRALAAAYGGKARVVDEIVFDVAAGAMVALIGANGAGKTTLIRAISGLLPLHGGALLSGSVRVAGVEATRLGPEHIVRLGVGQVPEGRLVFRHLTVEDNLRVGAAVLAGKLGRERIQAVYEMFPRLSERRQQPAGLLSGGEQQMLALGRALSSAPRILLIDELSLGLAPIIVRTIYTQLSAIRETFGVAMLVVEQNARLALEICDHAHVLERGRIALSGSARELAGSERVRELYLGAAPGGRVA